MKYKNSVFSVCLLVVFLLISLCLNGWRFVSSCKNCRETIDFGSNFCSKTCREVWEAENKTKNSKETTDSKNSNVKKDNSSKISSNQNIALSESLDSMKGSFKDKSSSNKASKAKANDEKELSASLDSMKGSFKEQANDKIKKYIEEGKKAQALLRERREKAKRLKYPCRECLTTGKVKIFIKEEGLTARPCGACKGTGYVSDLTIMLTGGSIDATLGAAIDAESQELVDEWFFADHRTDKVNSK